ncbi:unnamed protein product [Cuscuta europaea]|uniref:Retrotransposon gag domain-containing protein n=1 Tax=Cuscuta europaea TaxID=41803 RepID=A0A9P0YZV3_CUSEU|nr:unnamed protein product [Cuscuta europaea]
MPPRRDIHATPTVDELAQTVQRMAQLIGAAQPQKPGIDYATRVAGRNPPKYLGEEDHLILEDWIRTFDKLFDSLNCPSEQRVNIAVYYLHQETDHWWAANGPALLRQPGFDWEDFIVALRDRFYPDHVKEANYEEFVNIKQGDLTVQEYHTKFVQLARFAKDLVSTEASMTRRFVNGLNFGAQKFVTVAEPRNLNEAYRKAGKYYLVHQKEREAHKRDRRMLRWISNKRRPEPTALSKGKSIKVEEISKTRGRGETSQLRCDTIDANYAQTTIPGRIVREMR